MNGIEVAPTGDDVTTTATKDMLFTSQAVSLKNVIADGGTATTVQHTNPNNSNVVYIATVVIPHGLGYAPAFLFYYNFVNYDGFSVHDPSAWALHDNLYCSVSADENNLTAYFSLVSSANVRYKYFIFVERSK